MCRYGAFGDNGLRPQLSVGEGAKPWRQQPMIGSIFGPQSTRGSGSDGFRENGRPVTKSQCSHLYLTPEWLTDRCRPSLRTDMVLNEHSEHEKSGMPAADEVAMLDNGEAKDEVAVAIVEAKFRSWHCTVGRLPPNNRKEDVTSTVCGRGSLPLRLADRNSDREREVNSAGRQNLTTSHRSTKTRRMPWRSSTRAGALRLVSIAREPNRSQLLYRLTEGSGSEQALTMRHRREGKLIARSRWPQSVSTDGDDPPAITRERGDTQEGRQGGGPPVRCKQARGEAHGRAATTASTTFVLSNSELERTERDRVPQALRNMSSRRYGGGGWLPTPPATVHLASNQPWSPSSLLNCPFLSARTSLVWSGLVWSGLVWSGLICCARPASRSSSSYEAKANNECE
ncbi:unnamed protein product [Soboliphyme baturini]|uniref:Uncharacterized protein n=1 Tax=Soboliphyme baturini TaxID=241478 RepID=A0A183II99_9BILA|nr:unnamed protein product [Soboliphyme baturini]